MTDVQVGVKHGHDDFGLGKALPHGLEHGFAQSTAHLGKARRIHKNNLGVLVRKDAHNLIARGLRLGGDDGHLLAEQGVQQGGFARVGRPHKRDPAATIVLIRHSFSRLETSSLYRRKLRREIFWQFCRARAHWHDKGRPMRANISKKLRFRVRAGMDLRTCPAHSE